MDKSEFKKEVESHLKELCKLYEEFAPEDAGLLSVTVDKDYYSSFILRRDKDDNPIEGEYIFDVTYIKDDESEEMQDET
jgi:hypothetical protein